MALPPRVFDGRGVPVTLGTEIGRGGEGAVYDIHGRADSVAKVYLRAPNSTHQAKLSAMTGMAASSLLRLAAWPTSTLHGSFGSVVGFIMPKVTGRSPVFKLYGPKLRLQEFPKADWRFLIHAAANTARAFSAIHANGLVIGDVNHGNLVVGQDATVRLIDCDSFQVSKDKHTWFCEVGVGTHQPPEMQGLVSFAGVTRTANHDNFGLAVIIFQLLCMARHPFAGRYVRPGDPPSIEEAIAQSRYAYSSDQRRTLMAPPPGSLPIEALTPDLRDLFETAFAPGTTRGGRPAGDRWITALSKLASNLRECPQNQAHRYASSLAHCPWCEIEAASGTPLFPVVFISSAGWTSGIAALWQEVTRQAEPPSLPPFPDPNHKTATPSVTARAAARTGRRLQIIAYSALVASSAFAFYTAAPNFQLWLMIAIGAFAVAIYGIRTPATAGPEKRRFAEVKSDWEALRASWNIPADMPSFGDIRRDLDAAKAKYDGLADQRARRLNQLSLQIRQMQLEEHLDRSAIASAKIPGIGAAKSATLSSYGIDTAGDIEYAKVRRVPGFGEVTTQRLLDWRRKCEQAFRFDPRRGISASDLAAVERDIAMSRLSLERNITADLGRLKTISVAVIARHKALDGRAAELMPLYEQASADAYIVPGDPTTHKRLLGLAATTAAIALIMLGTGSVPKAGSPTAKIVGPVPTTNEPSSISAPNQPPPALSKDATANPLQILPAVVPAGTAQRTVPIPAPAIAKTDLEKLVVRQTANVRDAPNGSTVLRTVTQGMVVRVFARRDGWVQIGDDAPWGWVSSKLLAEIP